MKNKNSTDIQFGWFVIFFILFATNNCLDKKKLWKPTPLKAIHNQNVTQDIKNDKKEKHFSIKDISSDTKIVMLNFFAPLCLPCIEEAEELVQFYYDYIANNPKVEFFFIASTLRILQEKSNIFLSEDIENIQRFIKKYQLPKPIYIANMQELMSYNVVAFPETFILFRNSQNHFFIKRKIVSKAPILELKEYIDTLL